MTQDAADGEAPEWSTDRIEKAFRADLAERFRAHNEAFRKREEEDLAAVHPDKRGQPGYEVRDSFAWEFLQHCQIQIERNTATIAMPIGFAFRPDLLPLFDHTSVAWSRPMIGATIVDGLARPTIEITLVATWTDALDAAWKKEGNARRHVLVELYEDEVHALCAFIARHADASCDMNEDPSQRWLVIRDRLKLALEPIP